jgi:hypothetical protein
MGSLVMYVWRQGNLGRGADVSRRGYWRQWPKVCHLMMDL